MGWDEYVTGPGGLIAQYNKIACGGIFGTNGSTFAQSGMDHAQAQYTEIIDLANLFENPTPGFEKGFKLNGYDFALVRIQDKQILHGKGKVEGALYPLTVQKTAQALVVAIGATDAQAGQISLSVGKIADYLETAGY
jgi:hypothetical protein